MIGIAVRSKSYLINCLFNNCHHVLSRDKGIKIVNEGPFVLFYSLKISFITLITNELRFVSFLLPLI